MAENTKIEWADHTFNPWEGCTKVGPGCDHCYAEARNNRFHGGNWGPGAPRRRTSEANWRLPIKWNREAGEKGIRYRVFCASLADVFDNEVDPQWRFDLFALIRATPNLDWLLLTKRIGNVETMTYYANPVGGPARLPNNVWLGATVVNQEEADRDIPKLLQIPAMVRFLSIEPMLGDISLDDLVEGRGTGNEHHYSCLSLEGLEPEDDPWGGALISWVICGGESGPGARPMHPDWPRSLRDQCKAADVPFLFKQWGEYAPNWFNNPSQQKIAGSEWMDRMGKKVAGRTLDGMTHTEFPA